MHGCEIMEAGRLAYEISVAVTDIPEINIYIDVFGLKEGLVRA